MSKDNETLDRIDETASHMLVALIGTSLGFSDQMIRFLALEFPEVRFRRVSNFHEVRDVAPRPRLVVVHESVSNLEAALEQTRAAFGDAMIAVACSELPACFRDRRSGPPPAVSFLRTTAQVDVWLSVLRLLLCGHAYVPPEFMHAWRKEPSHASPAPERDSHVDTPDALLTPRELQILPLIARGMQNKMIAGQLGVSEHTVKLHTHNIFSKLRVSNRTGAANWYLSQMEGPAAAGHEMHAK